MYLITSDNKLFAVNIKNRTCIIGFRDARAALKVMSNLRTNGMKIRLKGVSGFATFNTNDLSDVSVMESTWDIGCLIDINYMLIYVADDSSLYKQILTIQGVLTHQDYNDLKNLRPGYLDELYKSD